MKIYAADLFGVFGRTFELDVMGVKDHQGVHLLGSARKIIQQGIIQRVRFAIEAMDEGIMIGEDIQLVIDINPPNYRLESPGHDLPVALILLKAYYLYSLQALNDLVKDLEERHAKLGAKETEKAAKQRKDILEKLEQLKAQRQSVKALHGQVVNSDIQLLPVGKLTLGGDIVAPDAGMYSMLDTAKEGTTIIVPPEGERIAGLVAKSKKGVRAVVASTLREAWEVALGIRKGRDCKFSLKSAKRKELCPSKLDLRAIRGCYRGKQALEVCLAGGHPLLLQGPGGQGKTMLGEAATRLLPELSADEMRQVNAIYSAKGLLKENELVLSPPYQTASGRITEAALFGGGVKAEPGLLSLAHRGILFFDEFNLASSSMINNLRGPMNDGHISVQRQQYSLDLPSKFILIAAMNPCNCGFLWHYTCQDCGEQFIYNGGRCPKDGKHRVTNECKCSKRDIDRFSGHLSGPIKDRFDLMTMVSMRDTFMGNAKDYSSQHVKIRIKKARRLQRKRYAKLRGNRNQVILTNGDVENLSVFEQAVSLPKSIASHFEKRIAEHNIKTMRKTTRLILVCQTVADLNGDGRMTKEHIDWAFGIAGI